MLKNKIYKAAIIGCGRMGSEFDDDELEAQTYGIRSHAGGYTDNPNTELIAVSDVSEDKLNKCGVRWNVQNLYQDYKEMLHNEEIDILSICTWNTTHLEILEAASSTNVKVVFCEKPISNSIQDADKMIQIAHDNNIALFIDHMRRWDEVYRDVNELVKSGKLGKIQQVSCYYIGGIANTCSHLFDVLRMFFGDVETVTGFYKGDVNSGDPYIDGYIKFINGTTATLQYIDIANYVIFEFDIYGEFGRIRIEDNGFNIRYWITEDSTEDVGCKVLAETDSPIHIGEKRMMKNTVSNIVSCLSSKSNSECNGEDGLKSLEIICAFIESAKNNKTITLPLKNRNITIDSK